MRRIKELLRLSAAGLSYRQMAGATGLSLGSISRYLKAAQDAGLSWPMAAELAEADLAVRLVGSGIEPGRARSGFVEPDYAAIHQHASPMTRRRGHSLRPRGLCPEGCGQTGLEPE